MKKSFVIKFLSIIILSLFSNNLASAGLNGIFKMDLLIEPFEDDGAKECGITEKQIETSIKYILANSEIKILDKFNLDYPTLYFVGSIGNNNGTCYGGTRIQVYKHIQDPKTYNWGNFIYYSKGAISSGGTGNFAGFYLEQLEQIVKMFVVKHSEDNWQKKF